MTEHEIECAVERMTDAADHAYLTGAMTEAAYERRCREINEWAENALRNRRR